ncbi:MAG TPA: STT3 domain-containing protein [Myxococcota bacterium]|nr:STT3 domain-containing protein [Myxococcota bacterium]
MRRLVPPLALFACALAVRAANWRDVFAGERVLPVDPDSWYHLRRIAYGIASSGDVLEFDRYLSFPGGAKPIWTPVFDTAAAALLGLFAHPPQPDWLLRLERLAMWLPPLLGAVTVVLVWRIGRRHFGDLAGLAAGVVLCFVSGHYWYSQIGFLDHHAALGLVAAWLLGSTLAWMQWEESRLRAAAWRSALVCGTAIAATLATWPGGVLHAALIEVGALAFAVTRADADDARGFAFRRATAYLVATLWIAPLTLGNVWPQWGDLSPVVLTTFQPLLFATAFAIWLGCAFAWRGDVRTPPARLAVFAGIGVVVTLALLVALPDVRAGVADAWRWLAKRESFQSHVAESQPLLFDDGHFNVAIAASRLSLFGLFFPLAGAWLAWRLRGRPERARAWLVLGFTAGLYAVTLLQRRFFDTACIGIALSLGLAARELGAMLRPRLGSPLRARAAVAALVALMLLPSFRSYVRALANEWNALRGAPQWVTGVFGFDHAGLELALQLDRATPPTAGWLDPSQAPEYGVLAPWFLGHIIEHAGRRPTVVDNFGDDLGPESFAFAERAYQSREDEIAPELARRRIRYVVAHRFPSFLERAPEDGSLFHALFALDGSQARDAGGAVVVPALAQHRLVFETLGRDFGDPEAPPVYKLFERVAGAEVSGRAAPGAPLEVALSLRTNRGRAFLYQTQVAAGADGRYRVRLPYATDGGPAAVTTAPYYRFACGDEVRGLVVGERAVQEGLALRGPDLCRGGFKQPAAAPDAGSRPSEGT